jgi:hypothetical protein
LLQKLGVGVDVDEAHARICSFLDVVLSDAAKDLFLVATEGGNGALAARASHR